MLLFGVTIPGTVAQRSEIPEGLMNYPALSLFCFILHDFVLELAILVLFGIASAAK